MLDYWNRKLWGDRQGLGLLVAPDHEPSPEDRRQLFKANVELLHLELSRRCNRKCDYCPVAGSDRQSVQELMDDALLDAVLGDLAGIDYRNTINLNLYNEPLLSPRIVPHVALVRRFLPKAYVTINTNGDALKGELLRELSEAGINHCCVTLHPKPHTTASGEEIVRRVTRLLEKLGHVPDAPLDLPALVETSRSLAFRLHGVSVSVQWPDWNRHGSSRGGQVIALDIGRTVRTRPCVRPFREFSLYHDGTVTPCCEVFHDGTSSEQSVGRVRADGRPGLFDVYASHRLNAFRRNVFDYGEKDGVCKRCTYADRADGGDRAARAEILRETSADDRRSRLAG